MSNTARLIRNAIFKVNSITTNANLMPIAEDIRPGVCMACPKRSLLFPPFLLAAVLTIMSFGTTADTSGSERWQLWNGLEPVSIHVEPLSDESRNIGLTEKVCRTAVENRLRGTRIHDGNADAHAYVRVSVVGEAFSIGVLFRPRVHRSGLGSGLRGNLGKACHGPSRT